MILLTLEHCYLLQNELAEKAARFYMAALALGKATGCASLARQGGKDFITCRLLTAHCS